MKKLLFFVTEDWYFCSHRLALAIAARNSGYDVAVLTNTNRHADTIISAGLRLIPFSMSRRSINPFTEFFTVIRLIKIYREETPAILHHVAIKPVLYGSIASKFVRVSKVVNALAGLGWLYTSKSLSARILKAIVRVVFRVALRDTHIIVQNPDDAEVMRKFPSNGVHIIKGSGVDTTVYSPSEEPEGVPVILLPARMLWDKGIADFVAAAMHCQEQSIAARFVLVGSPDEHNPASIPLEQLHEWNDKGVVEWWGERDNMPLVYKESHIVCLPSYREGLPKVLLEAAASCRAIVTTDVPGCREVVIDGFNGYLVPVNSPINLAVAIIKLIESPDTRHQFARNGRHLVERGFSSDVVNAATLDVYRQVAD